MKRILYLLSFFFIITAHAQDDSANGGGKVRERMQEYLQKKLDLSGDEVQKFGPVFLNYFNDLRKTTQQYKDDRLVQQQKVADLKLHYRDQFKDIMGEKRSNDMFNYERDFINEVKKLRQERLQNQPDIARPNKKDNGLLH